MPHAAPTPPAPPAPVPVTGPLAGLLSEQSTPLGVFLALARIGLHFLIRFLPYTTTLARSYPRHWRALVESNLSLLRVLLTVRFAPERITISQFRRLWRARQLIERLFGPLPIFHSQSLGPRTSSSATPAYTPSPSPNSPSPNPPSAAPLGTPGSRLASAPTPSIPQPHTPSVPQVPFCSLSHSPSRSDSSSDSRSSSRSHTRSPKRAPASLQSIIAMMESSDSNPQPKSPHSAFRTPHSLMPPFIPDAATLHAALKADTLPPNCAGALLDKPADTLVKALRQVHALIHAFPHLSPSPSPSQSEMKSPSPSQSNSTDQSVRSVQSVQSVASDLPQSEISNFKSEIHPPHPASPSPHSTAPP